MKKLYWLIVLLLSAASSSQAQTVIADQQCAIAGANLRLVTYEKTSDGYRNALMRDGVARDENDSGLVFSLASLDANVFHNLFWNAVDSLLGSSELPAYVASDYAEASKLFATIVLAANFIDSRPVAGRLILNQRILGYKNGVLRKNGDRDRYLRPKYFINPSNFTYYLECRKQAQAKYKYENGVLATAAEQLRRLRQSMAQDEAQLSSIEAILPAIADSLDQVDQRIRDFDAHRRPALQKSVDSTVAITNRLTTLLRRTSSMNSSHADSLLADSLRSRGVWASMLQDKIDAQKRFVQLQTIVLRESGLQLSGKGNQTIRRHLKLRADALTDAAQQLTASLKENAALKEQLEAAIADTKNDLDADYFLVSMDSVRIEFNEGMIERVVAVAHRVPVDPDDASGESIVFTNVYPIGFSTFRNYKNTLRTQLLVDGDNQFMIPLNDLIDYIPNIRLDTRDFSPSDTAETFDPAEHEFIMYKERTSDLLKARIYTDFVGLDEAQPNGLIQSEIEKRINLYTWRRPLFGGAFLNTSFFQFARPVVTLSKLEGKLRRLDVGSAPVPIDSVYDPTKFVRTLDLLKYENLSAGLDLNIWMLDSQPWKATLYANMGMRFGRVAMNDSLRVRDSTGIHATGQIDQFGVNTLRWFPEAMIAVYPDESFSFSVAYRPSYNLLLSDALQQVPNRTAIAQSPGSAATWSKWIHTFELAATVRLSERGELYARYRLHCMDGDWNTNFHQAQVGYSMTITQKLGR